MNTTEQNQDTEEHKRTGSKERDTKAKPHLRDLDTERDPKAGGTGDPDEGGQLRRR